MPVPWPNHHREVSPWGALAVTFTLNGVFASVKSDDVFGIIALAITGANPPVVTPVTPAAIDVEDRENGGNFDLLIERGFVVGPGNFPMSLAFDTLTLLVTGDDQVRLFNVSNPSLTTPPAVVSDTGESTIGIDPNETGATIQQALITNEVVIGDGQTGIIGGLIRETRNGSVSQVPLLGDLPLVGWLFRGKSRSRSKQKLVVRPGQAA